MIAKPRRRPAEPLDVHLSLSFRFGEEPDDRIQVMNNRRVPLVGSVFERRDAILRAFTRLLVQASVRSPKVARELLPGLRLLPGRKTR
ncbi:MAG TPA: hypothetical protein VFV27_12275 [Nevskiaceae bacterium]|nr:hypothetical protein [Nevskiaceae bacterium]